MVRLSEMDGYWLEYDEGNHLKSICKKDRNGRYEGICDSGESGFDDGFDAGFKEGHAKGSEEGHKQGFAEGRERGLKRILTAARKLLESGMSREEVEQLTSLSSQEMAKIIKR